MEKSGVCMSQYNRSEHLQLLHKNRKSTTKAKVEEAILRLLHLHRSVNFNSVSTESGITKSTLYNTPEIRIRIEALRSEQSQLPSPAQMKVSMDESNKDAVIASLQRKIKKLEMENHELKGQLKTSYTDFYEQL